MIKPQRLRTRLVAVSAAVLTAMCAGLLTPAQPSVVAFAVPNFTPIAGSGSTWSYPAIHAWQTNVAQNGLTVNYTQNGSTTGRQQFGQNTVDFAASEIPYGVRDGNNYDPPPARGYAYMPDTAGGTTFMYNLNIGTQRVTDLRLSGAVVAGIFTNTITMWNDPKIAADNPGLALPAIRVVPVVRSDGSGATAQFTQWMLATQNSAWNAYCAAVGRSPCTQTSVYPLAVQPGSAMIGQPGDTGVAGYVSQQQADGAIGYVEYSYAKQAGFPVAKVLNAAGYYTVPTPGHIAVSLLKAQINTDQTSPLYLTQDLSQVYTNPDARTYELSSYSYMILPTTAEQGWSSDKGYTLGQFGQYLLCDGQGQVDDLGYSALPINLVKAGVAQLQRIPGNTVATATDAFIQNCHNPTFSTDGTNTLADTDPQPPACDKQGATMCTTSTAGGGGGGGGGSGGGGSGGGGGGSGGGGSGGGGSGGSPTPGASGSHGSGGTGSGGTGGSSGSGSHGSGGTSGSGSTGTGSTAGAGASSSASGASGTGASASQSCDPNTGICSTGIGSANLGTSNTAANGGSANGTGSLVGGQLAGQPVAAPSGLGDGVQIALMALAAALLVGLGLVPALIGQASTRRRWGRGPGPFRGPGDWR